MRENRIRIASRVGGNRDGHGARIASRRVSTDETAIDGDVRGRGVRIGDGGGGIGEDASGTGEGRRGIIRGDEEDVGDDDVYDDARERVGAIATGVHGAKVFKFTGAAELRARGGWDGARSRRRQRRDGTVVDDGDGESARATRVEYGTGAGGEGAQSAVRSVDVCVGV